MASLRIIAKLAVKPNIFNQNQNCKISSVLKSHNQQQNY